MKYFDFPKDKEEYIVLIENIKSQLGKYNWEFGEFSKKYIWVLEEGASLIIYETATFAHLYLANNMDTKFLSVEYCLSKIKDPKMQDFILFNLDMFS